MSDVTDTNRAVRDDGIDQRLTRFGAGDARARAFLSVIAKGRQEVAPSRFDLVDYDSVDVALLPYLVRARSLQEFMFDGIPEDVVRQFLTHTAQLHEKKGTVAGAEFALSLLGMSPVWEQWWEVHPPAAPNTHTVTVYVSRQMFRDEPDLLSARAQAAAAAMIEATKRWSQAVTFEIGVGVGCDIVVGAAVSPVEFARVEAQTIIDDAEVFIDVGAATAPVEFARIDAQTLVDTDFEVALAIGVVISPVEFIKIEGVAA